MITLYSYYQKVPEELPQLEKKQVYGLATPEDFTLPPHHTLWTEETYKVFEVTAEASEKYDTKVTCTVDAPQMRPPLLPRVTQILE